jgi:hypothetical protein
VSPVTEALCASEPFRLDAVLVDEAVLERLLGVVPGAAAGGHRDRHEQAGDDDAEQHRAERREGVRLAGDGMLMTKKQTIGDSTGSSDGTIISRIAALVSMSTARP